MHKRRILIISTVGLMYDGITSVITSYLESMDLSNLDIRLVGTIKVEPTIRNKIETLGCEIIDFPNRKTETFKYFCRLKRYVRQERIEVVHAHGNSGTLAIDLLAAKLGGAEKRIAHSHNTRCDQVIADKLLRPLFYKLYTDGLACGREAGEWLFRGRPFKIISNGRSVEKYRFNQEIRSMMREKYGFGNMLVIGHVGGFVEQKNHAFLIKIFSEVLLVKKDIKLVLIGDGILRSAIEESAADLKDKVYFIGTTDKVENYLNMMDIMLLPSLFEGLPLVAIEWQINGLPCLISDTVTKECALSKMVEFVPLELGAAGWAKKIIEHKFNTKRIEDSLEAILAIKKAGFDIRQNAENMELLYEST